MTIEQLLYGLDGVSRINFDTELTRVKGAVVSYKEHLATLAFEIPDPPDQNGKRSSGANHTRTSANRFEPK